MAGLLPEARPPVRLWSGTVTRVEADGRVMVTLPRHTAGYQVGPCPVLRPAAYGPLAATAVVGAEAGTTGPVTVTGEQLVAGARVLVTEYDSPGEYVVLGRL